MPVKKYKPTSPGRRGMSVSSFEELTRNKPERSLTEAAEAPCRPQQSGPDHGAPSWWRPQAPLPHYRLQA